MTDEQLDAILELQLAVAWAGEADSDPPRMRWWRTGMCDEFGGEDLLKRLTPKTWEWAVFEAVRAAAKRVDERERDRADDPEHLRTLYRLGFEADEQLDERLLELKRNEVPFSKAFPNVAELSSQWSKERFERWLAALGESGYSATATGRRLTGRAPEDPCDKATRLTAALLPLAKKYPLPHFREGR